MSARLAAPPSSEVPSSCDVCPTRFECSVYMCMELGALVLRGGGYVRVEDTEGLGVPREAIEGLPVEKGCIHVEELQATWAMREVEGALRQAELTEFFKGVREV